MAVCETEFQIDEVTRERLRSIFDSYPDYDQPELRSFPLSVTLLRTPDEKLLGQNMAGVSSDVNPNFVMMCDIVVQFFSDADYIRFLDFYSLNKEDEYRSFIAIGDAKIKVNILDNDKRLLFLKQMHDENTIKPLVSNLTEVYELCY